MRPKSFFLLLHSSLAIFLLLFGQSLGIVCRKEKVGPFGVGDFRGGMNADCGQYVRHCLKIQMWDGSVIRDCDPLALCPKDGSKLINRADYFCCLGDLCNKGIANNKGSLAMAMMPLFLLLFGFSF